MTAVQAILTEAELTNWLTEQVGPEIRNDYDTARLLLSVFDLTAKEGNSLNNPHQIADCIASTPSTSGPFGPVDTVQAAGNLHEAYRITRKPADHERPLVDLPAPVIVSRHQCPLCRRFTRADARQVTDHMTRCWQNPGLRCCKTCTHHHDAGPYDDESCIHPDGPEYEEYRFPVLHCPLWQPKES
ncbi:hypothetical protein ACFC8N_42660 [Streptomyces sp. NPDC055966]|uniref:hypothetical protein n=1 Tax=Streptomyces sp. NPDC055966 TaxID=3345669 RepID=UPI0035D9B5D6